MTEQYNSILTELEINPNRLIHCNSQRKSTRSQKSDSSARSSKKKLNKSKDEQQLKDKQRFLLRQRKKLYSETIRQKNIKGKSPGQNISNSGYFSTKAASSVAALDFCLKKSKKVVQKEHPLDISQVSEINAIPMIRDIEISKEKPTEIQIRTRTKCLQNNFLKKHKGSLEDNEYFALKLKDSHKQKETSGMCSTQIESLTSSCIMNRPAIYEQANQFCKIQKWATENAESENFLNSQHFSIDQEKKETCANLIIENEGSKKVTNEQQIEMERCKSYISQLQVKVQDLLFWRGQLGNFFTESQNDKQQCSNKIVFQRLLSLEEEVFSLKKIKNSLEIKIHAYQRKLVEETDSIRKKCAKEINIWRQRYDKLAQQNSILKGNLNDTLSMQISREQ